MSWADAAKGHKIPARWRRMCEDPIAEAKALIEEAATTPGARVDADLQMVGRSLRIFTGNAAELRVQLDEDQSPETFLRLGPSNQVEFEEHLDEIDRLLHNFLAASYTLKQHTLKIKNRYADDNFSDEYASHNPFGDPVCHLVQRLRSDMQHAHLPAIHQREEYKRDPAPSFMCRLVVSRTYLATLDLNGETKQYLAALDADPAIEDLVDTYVRHVKGFAAWFIGAVVELRAQELGETLVLRQRAHNLAEPLRRALTPNRARRGH